MRVQNKLLIVTLALVMILIVITGLLFFRFGENELIERSVTQMRALADTIALQLESRVQQMDFALLYMLSQPDFLSATSYYTMPGRAEEANRLLISENAAVISRVMINYAVNKNFYRASLFTPEGDYFSSRFQEPSPSSAEVKTRVSGISWTDLAQSKSGRMLLLSPYSDPWSEEDIRVYSAVRAISTPSGVTCFIEIQNKARDLDELLQPAYSFGGMSAIMSPDGVFYSKDGVLEKDDILAVSDTNQYGLSIRVWQSREAILEAFSPMKAQIFAVCGVAFILSATYLYLASRRITSPIRAILDSMDKTALDTLTNPPLPSGGDELKALNEAFSRLCERLKSAVDEAFSSQEREARAKFDSLQAQMDPHFLYNTLNVIAGRAMATGDDEIALMCSDIASMLRYSTDTKQRSSTIGLEAAHLNTYLALMKKRYRQKLVYTVEISPNIESEPMPKIVLQQFAENALRHGFDGSANALAFTLRGYSIDEYWHIDISDNGKGFDE
ncbi:MAG: histidine kinase, partial [Clostridia bacterium]|nr:histidine kinase [Clostridia bacterium]